MRIEHRNPFLQLASTREKIVADLESAIKSFGLVAYQEGLRVRIWREMEGLANGVTEVRDFCIPDQLVVIGEVVSISETAALSIKKGIRREMKKGAAIAGVVEHWVMITEKFDI